MKIRPVGAELFHADGQKEEGETDTGTKLLVAFRYFAKASKEKRILNLKVKIT